jgi:bacteriocin biosynthesis cyclodehydratase domain-containing protein
MKESLPQLPRFRKSMVPRTVHARNALFLLDEHRQYVFEGSHYVALAPLLDGSHDLGAIMAKSKLAPHIVFAALANLNTRGCLVDAADLKPTETDAYWEYLRVPGIAAEASLSGATADVLCLTEFDPALVETALNNAGINTASRGSMQVVITDDYLHPDLVEINRRAISEQRPWLLIKPLGTVIWIGPFFVPGRTACWTCLHQRLSANRQAERYIANKNAGARFQTAKAWTASTINTGLNLAAMELARSIVLQESASLINRIITLDTTTFELEEHTLSGRPQCPSCGTGMAHHDHQHKPILLVAHDKIEGQSRTKTAEQTFADNKHHISPITGIVSSFQTRETDEFGPTHNYVAGHYFPMLSDDMNLLRVNSIARSGGKGNTEIQAKTSALCESIERYSGVCWGDEDILKSAYRDLGADAVHMRDIALFSDEQYAQREHTNQGVSEHHYVPDPLADDAVISWSPAWSLTEERTTFVPTAYVYYGHRDPGHFFCKCDSNGSAAGNTIEEAILQGFIELVERDCVALWWYNRIARPRVDVESFNLPYWHDIKNYYQHKLDRDIHVLDITSDLGIPAFAVVSRRRNREVEDIVLGFSAHLNPKTALSRALGEANQYLPALRMSAPDGRTIYQLNSGETIDWWKNATYANQSYLVPDDSLGVRSADQFQDLASRDVKQDIETCMDIVKRHGLNLLVIDQTRPDIGLPVAKVIVPGLRHFWRRLAPGRLYDVPVALGWTATPNSESALNPISCFV